MWPRMVLNVAPPKIVNALKPFFCPSVFLSVCVFNVWPKTTLLSVWPRHAERVDPLLEVAPCCSPALESCPGSQDRPTCAPGWGGSALAAPTPWAFTIEGGPAAHGLHRKCPFPALFPPLDSSWHRPGSASSPHGWAPTPPALLRCWCCIQVDGDNTSES